MGDRAKVFPTRDGDVAFGMMLDLVHALPALRVFIEAEDERLALHGELGQRRELGLWQCGVHERDAGDGIELGTWSEGETQSETAIFLSALFKGDIAIGGEGDGFAGLAQR